MTDQELSRLSPLLASATKVRRPHPRQAEFLGLHCEETLYGGAAGGGKTEALLMWLAQRIELPGYSAIFFRRTYAQLSKSNDSPLTKAFDLFRPLGGHGSICIQDRRLIVCPQGNHMSVGIGTDAHSPVFPS